MVEIPDSLYTLFSATVEERDDRYVVTLPAEEVERTPLQVGETCRVALLERADEQLETPSPSEMESQPAGTGTTGRTREYDRSGPERPEPPVEVGETRTVTVEAIGDKGDGIAKVERGYVVIVPGAGPGEEVPVEITSVQENVAFAEVLEE